MNKGSLNLIVFANTGIDIVQPLYESGLNIVGVIESNNKAIVTNRMKKLLRCLKRLITFRSGTSNLYEFAKKKSIPYLEYNGKIIEQVIDWIKQKDADLMISHQAPILTKSIFSLPKFGSINIHPTLLPKYRGSNPFFWMYYHKDMTAGITIHKIDEDIDTGAILAQRSCSIDYGTDAIELESRMIKELALPALIDLLDKPFFKGKEVQQPKESPTPYARRLSDDEYNRLVFSDRFNIKEFWHLLHANHQWKHAIIKEYIDEVYDWEIGTYELIKHNLKPGGVCLNKGKLGVIHREGIIWVLKKFNLKKYIARRVFSV